MTSVKIVNTRVAEDVYEKLRECSDYLGTGSVSELVLPSLIQRGELAKIIKDRGVEKEQAEELFIRARALAILFQEDNPEDIRRLGDLFQSIGCELDQRNRASKCLGGLEAKASERSAVRAKFINVRLCLDIYEDLKATCQVCGNTVSNVLYCEILRWCSAAFVAKEKGLIPDRQTTNLEVVRVINLVLAIPDPAARQRFGGKAREWAYNLADLKERAFDLSDLEVG
ncbi:MAG: hypothetical protein ACLFPU_08700 [Dehalococcoidia bacterium]